MLFHLLPFSPFPSLEISTDQSLWFGDCSSESCKRVKALDLHFPLGSSFCNLKEKKSEFTVRTIVFPAPPTPLFSGLCNQLWQHLKMLISQTLKLLIPEKLYMNDFLSISSYLWVAPNRKLSNISDSKPPTNRQVKS